MLKAVDCRWMSDTSWHRQKTVDCRWMLDASWRRQKGAVKCKAATLGRRTLECYGACLSLGSVAFVMTEKFRSQLWCMHSYSTMTRYQAKAS